MASDQKSWIDKATDKAVDAGSLGMFKGLLVSGFSIALISVTRAVPEDWEAWYQNVCFGLFLLGILKISVHLFFSKD